MDVYEEEVVVRKGRGMGGGGVHDENYEYQLDHIDAEDDEEIDEDAAFNEDDEEKYGEFFRQMEQRRAGGEGAEEEEEEEEEGEESDMEGAIDLSEMLSQGTSASASSSKNTNRKHEAMHELPSDDEDEDEEADVEEEQDLTSFIQSLNDGKKRKATGDAPGTNRKKIKELSEAYEESEFNLSTRSGRIGTALCDVSRIFSNATVYDR